MLSGSEEKSAIDERTVGRIVEQVIAALREDLEAIAAGLANASQPAGQLTVAEVAQQLGVARSTVYAHWREWGGYKLGRGDKAPIRFDGGALPVVVAASALRATPPSLERRRAGRRRTPRDLIADAPRLTGAPDGVI